MLKPTLHASVPPEAAHAMPPPQAGMHPSSPGLVSLCGDEIGRLCSFLGWEDIVSLSLTCNSLRAAVLHSPDVWRACYEAAFPCPAVAPSFRAGEWLGEFRKLNKQLLRPSRKVPRRAVTPRNVCEGEGLCTFLPLLVELP